MVLVVSLLYILMNIVLIGTRKTNKTNHTGRCTATRETMRDMSDVLLACRNPQYKKTWSVNVELKYCSNTAVPDTRL